VGTFSIVISGTSGRPDDDPMNTRMRVPAESVVIPATAKSS
jgi:hypothetical protein